MSKYIVANLLHGLNIREFDSLEIIVDSITDAKKVRLHKRDGEHTSSVIDDEDVDDCIAEFNDLKAEQAKIDKEIEDMMNGKSDAQGWANDELMAGD